MSCWHGAIRYEASRQSRFFFFLIIIIRAVPDVISSMTFFQSQTSPKLVCTLRCRDTKRRKKQRKKQRKKKRKRKKEWRTWRRESWEKHRVTERHHQKKRCVRCLTLSLSPSSSIFFLNCMFLLSQSPLFFHSFPGDSYAFLSSGFVSNSLALRFLALKYEKEDKILGFVMIYFSIIRIPPVKLWKQGSFSFFGYVCFTFTGLKIPSQFIFVCNQMSPG